MKTAFRNLILLPLGLSALLVAGCSKSGDLSQENTDKVKIGMTLPGVEKIIGTKGTKASDIELSEKHKRRSGFLHQTLPGATRYAWQDKNTLYYVDISDTSQKVAGMGRYSGS